MDAHDDKIIRWLIGQVGRLESLSAEVEDLKVDLAWALERLEQFDSTDEREPVGEQTALTL